MNNYTCYEFKNFIYFLKDLKVCKLIQINYLYQLIKNYPSFIMYKFELQSPYFMII